MTDETQRGEEITSKRGEAKAFVNPENSRTTGPAPAFAPHAGDASEAGRGEDVPLKRGAPGGVADPETGIPQSAAGQTAALGMPTPGAEEGSLTGTTGKGVGPDPQRSRGQDARKRGSARETHD